MEQREIEFIPERLNQQPVIFIGMTDGELKLAGGISVVFWVPVCVLIAWTFGYALLGVGAGALMTFGTLWLLGKKFRAIKRGKPRGYHVMLISAWLEDRNLKPKTMIRQSQVWSIRRKQ